MARDNKLGAKYARAGRYKGGRYVYALPEDKDRIIIQLPAATRDKLEALGWLLNARQEYAGVARLILRRGVDAMIAELPPKEREMLEERILPNVQMNREIARKQSRERAMLKNQELRMSKHDDETQLFPDLPDLTEDDEIPAP